LLSLVFSSCRKEASSSVSTNPNIVNGCEIIQAQVVTTNLVSHQVHTYINQYQYDSLGRLTYAGDDLGNDSSHFHYHDNDCDDDNHGSWHSSSNGYTVSSEGPRGRYQYSYDGNGYLQLEIYTDSSGFGPDDSYTESYYWDNNNNLSLSIKQYSSQTIPLTTTYSYYTDKANQVLVPSTLQLGKHSRNLIQQKTSSEGNTVVSSYSYSYIYDGSGKVAQYTETNQGHQQAVYTLIYSCH